MDKSTLFYLLITVSLITLIVFNYFTKPPPSIVSLSDIRIELETDKAEYSVNEDIEVTVYLCNDKPHAVRIEKIIEYNSIGYSLADPDRKVGVDLGHGYPENVYIQIPPNSRIKIHTVTFTPKYPGDFFIKILGESITVKVENEEISK